MGLVLEHDQPLLGVEDIGDWRLEIGTLTTMEAALTSSETSRLSSSPEAREFAHADEGDVHQGDRFVRTAEFFAGGEVGLPGALDGPGAFVERDILDSC